MRICKEEKAITEGQFFDLMYVNYENWNFNPNKQFAFLRKQDNEVLLIIANFNDIPAHVSVNIPAHAFECLGIPPLTQHPAVDLLTGKEESVNILPDKPVQMEVGSFNGRILKFTF